MDFLYGIVNTISTPSLRRSVSFIKFGPLSLTAFQELPQKAEGLWEFRDYRLEPYHENTCEIIIQPALRPCWWQLAATQTPSAL